MSSRGCVFHYRALVISMRISNGEGGVALWRCPLPIRHGASLAAQLFEYCERSPGDMRVSVHGNGERIALCGFVPRSASPTSNLFRPRLPRSAAESSSHLTVIIHAVGSTGLRTPVSGAYWFASRA